MNIMKKRVDRAGLQGIAAKVRGSERLTRDDGLELFACDDAHAVAYLANIVRERLHGDFAYYNINRHINYSNLCILTCKFCAFAKKRNALKVERKRRALAVTGAPRHA